MRELIKHVRTAEDGSRNVCLPNGVITKVVASLAAGSTDHYEILDDPERTKALFDWLELHGLDPDLTRSVVVVADGDGQVLAQCYVPDENGHKQIRYIEATQMDGTFHKIAAEPMIDDVVTDLKEPWPWT